MQKRQAAKEGVSFFKGCTIEFVLILIKLYQRFISPLKPRTCRFYPSCSQYCFDAISRYGIMKGCYLGAIRILKCHPIHPGGYDPVK